MRCTYCNKKILKSNFNDSKNNNYCCNECEEKGKIYFEKSKNIKELIILVLLILLILLSNKLSLNILNIILLPITAYYLLENLNLNFLIKHIGIKNSKILFTLLTIILLLIDFINLYK